ncbi:hypothetical protein EYF80_045659 [Liparis tanakae]|uniref:Uncharacterized protein n=1 Tax=Liparis tanakae TaxID=230148 RepID=A0A4Z2FTE9_9TELE|nr:hypothetical protein EYF80_045659 [Liparis tanakae]
MKVSSTDATGGTPPGCLDMDFTPGQSMVYLPWLCMEYQLHREGMPCDTATVRAEILSDGGKERTEERKGSVGVAWRWPVGRGLLWPRRRRKSGVPVQPRENSVTPPTQRADEPEGSCRRVRYGRSTMALVTEGQSDQEMLSLRWRRGRCSSPVKARTAVPVIIDAFRQHVLIISCLSVRSGYNGVQVQNRAPLCASAVACGEIMQSQISATSQQTSGSACFPHGDSGGAHVGAAAH